MAEPIKGHIGMDGEGLWLLFKMIKPVVIDGVKTFEVKIKPTEELKRVYDIKDSEYDQDFTITKRYDADDFVPINMNPGTESWIMLCTYDNRPGNILKLLDQKVLKDKEFYKKQFLLLKDQVRRLFYELEQAKKHPKQAEKELIERMEGYKKVLASETQVFGGPPGPSEEGY